MDNRLKAYVSLLILVFIGIGFVEVNRPREIDWRPNYSVNKKTPYGLYVLEKEMKTLFNGIHIEKLNETPYEFFDKQFEYDSSIANYTIRGTYFSIENDSKLDEESVNEILSFVSKGNEAFLSANTFPQILLDSLDLTQSSIFDIHDTVLSKLNYLDSTKYQFNKINQINYFDSIDTARLDVLGHLTAFRDDTSFEYVNFIRMAHGDGFIFLHSLPNVFTNYHLLKANHSDYASSVLSFIQNSKPIYWNTNEYERGHRAETPLRVILEYASLRWAWYFILIGFLIYLLFNAKRKQRIIPIRPPVQNTTVDFTKTIANMYFQDGHFKTIIEKRIIYFLERVRSEFHLDTNILDDRFISKLQLKSGRPKELIDKIVKKITNKKLNRYLTENDLVELNGLLEEFWRTKS